MAIALSWVRLLDQSTEMNELTLALFRECLNADYGRIDIQIHQEQSLRCLQRDTALFVLICVSPRSGCTRSFDVRPGRRIT